MARSASVTLDFADGPHHFRLAWGELGKLQEECDAGPLVVLGRLHDSTWRVKDISSVIRLGLVGGGMDPAKAIKLVRSWVEDRPPLENLPLAQAVLAAGCVGAPEEELGKAEAPGQEAGSTISPTGRSGSEPSMEPAP